MENKQKALTKKLVLSAVFIALATVLSEFKIIPMPVGGGVTPLSMLPIVLLPIMYGAGWGCFSCGVYAVVQLLFGLDSALAAPTAWGVVGSILLDYLVAYFALCIVGFFKAGNKYVITAGTVLSIVARYTVNTLASCVVWGDLIGDFWGTFTYGLAYNAYILVEGAAVCVVVFILLQNKSFRKIIGK